MIGINDNDNDHNNADNDDDDDDTGDDFTADMHWRAEILASTSSTLLSGDEGMMPSRSLMGSSCSLIIQEEKEAKTSNKDANNQQQQQQEKHLTVSSSKKQEVETIQKVLQEVDMIGESRRRKDGLREFNFTCGVMNCFLVAYIFGRYPQHFWLLYTVESSLLLPLKVRDFASAKPLNEILYLLDFCWVMNFLSVFTLLAMDVVSVIQQHQQQQPVEVEQQQQLRQGMMIVATLLLRARRELFLSAIGIACGPLLGATAVLPFLAVLFHDVKTMTGVFIHILPPMVAYTLLWHSDEIREAWPAIFQLDYMNDITYFPMTLGNNGSGGGGGDDDEGGGGGGREMLLLGSIAGDATLIYLLWLLPYTGWMVLFGMDLPRSDRKRENGASNGGWRQPISSSSSSSSSSKNNDIDIYIVPKYDTVFHSWMRGGSCILIGTKLWKRPRATSIRHMETDHYEMRDFVFYMVVHVVLAMASIWMLGYVCVRYKELHAALLWFVAVICVRRGSKRYIYYTTRMYGRRLREKFAHLLKEEEEEEEEEEETEKKMQSKSK